MKRAIDVVSANANPDAPIVLFIDEIEKGLAGTSGAGNFQASGDGGSTDRSNAQFLKFLSDARPKGIYIIATCNDIERLPAAYVRAERWDTAPIFVDLPNVAERNAILSHYKKVFGIKADPKDTTGWSGAELKTWCKLAAKKVSIGKKANDADELVIPVAKTMAREIDYLLKWKEGRTIPANRRKVVEQKVSGRKLDI
jgi:SpoVK/Ycf46/Vps4 family AAA+-type ATPase